MEKKHLQALFNVGDIEYRTFKSLPPDTALVYLTKFKKNFTVDDFDLFITARDPYTYGDSTLNSKVTKKNILKIYGIDEIPKEIYGQWDKDSAKRRRENDTQFNRELKLKLLQI